MSSVPNESEIDFIIHIMLVVLAVVPFFEIKSVILVWKTSVLDTEMLTFLIHDCPEASLFLNEIGRGGLLSPNNMIFERNVVFLSM